MFFWTVKSSEVLNLHKFGFMVAIVPFVTSPAAFYCFPALPMHTLLLPLPLKHTSDLGLFSRSSASSFHQSSGTLRPGLCSFLPSWCLRLPELYVRNTLGNMGNWGQIVILANCLYPRKKPHPFWQKCHCPIVRTLKKQEKLPRIPKCQSIQLKLLNLWWLYC